MTAQSAIYTSGYMTTRRRSRTLGWTRTKEDIMAHVMRTQAETSELRTVRLLIGIAIVAALVAAAAGLILVIASPESGSTAEATLGLTAAISGLTSAGFAIGAAIYAQVKNLWRHAPVWVRAAAWVVIAVVIGMTVWNLITQTT